jgi:hypothetical protein
MGAPKEQVVNFIETQTSEAFTLGNFTIQTIVVPASFGATSLALYGSSTEGGVYTQISLVDASMTVTDFVFTINASTSKRYSVTGSFPAGTEWLKLVAAGAVVVGKSVIVESKEV